MKVRAPVPAGTPWWLLPAPWLCEDCLYDPDIPSGREHVAVMQVRGVELCQFHIEQRQRPVEERLGWKS